MKNIIRSIKQFFDGAKRKSSAGLRRIPRFIDRKPFASFFVALGIFILLIILSNIFGTPKVQEKPVQKQIKPIQVYSVGGAPHLKVQAQIEKSGVLRITSLTAGVVQKANKREGDSFKKGETLISLSSNYQGGSTPSLQRSLAQTQYNNAIETETLQKEIIQKQREIAEKTDANSDELRSITEKSLGETRSLITANEDVLNLVDQKIQDLGPTTPANIDAIIQYKSLKSQFVSANNQARQGLRSAEYQSAGDKPPAALSDAQKDLTLKQLNLQEKMLGLNKEISRIQLKIAQVTEAMMFPAAPFNGVVQQVLVKEGEAVNPGEELLVIAQDVKDDPTLAIAYVPKEVAEKVSLVEPSILWFNKNESVHLQPSYISQDAVRGTLHAIYFTFPNEYIPRVTETGFIDVEIPVGHADTSSSIPYVPVDAVYQTKENNYLYVMKHNKAVSKKVQLGNVFGSFVEVTQGLNFGDQIITNRNVIVGDDVRVVN